MVIAPAVIPNTYIRIDNFASDADIYILTHAHTDHMQGLRAGWNAGPLFCSPVTARLLRRRGVARTVRPQELGVPFQVTNRFDNTTMTITLINANHCPGSAMAVIENLAQGTVVFTGDFRFSEDIRRDPVLNRVAGCVQHLYMDTSFDIPWLPSKSESVRDVIALIHAFPAENVILHSHGLGDEEILLAAANAFPHRPFQFWNEDRLADLKETHPKLIQTLQQRPLQRPCFHIVKSKHERRKHQLEGVEVACSCLWFAIQGVSVNAPTVEGDLHRVPFSMHSSKDEWQELRRWLAPKATTPICGTIASAAGDPKGIPEESGEEPQEEDEETEDPQEDADRREEARVRAAITASAAFYRQAVSPFTEEEEEPREPEDTRDLLDILQSPSPKRAKLF